VFERLGRYVLTHEVARGDIATIHRAYQTMGAGIVRPVTIKLPQPGQSNALLEEGRTTSRFEHANIVQLYDIDQASGQWFVAVERVQGQDLATVVRKAKLRGVIIDPHTALFIGIQVLQALSHAHERTDNEGNMLGIVHRDVCPANILIGYGGEVKLDGFGYAKMRGRANPPQPGTPRPRYGHISPEQALSSDVDHRADVFSVGLILYELLSGMVAYDARSELDALARAQRGQVRSLQEVAPTLGPEVREVVERALIFDRKMRHPSALVFRDELARVLYSRDPTFAAYRVATLMARVLGDEATDDRSKEGEERAAVEAQLMKDAPPFQPHSALELTEIAGRPSFQPESNAAASLSGVMLKPGDAPARATPTPKLAVSATSPRATQPGSVLRTPLPSTAGVPPPPPPSSYNSVDPRAQSGPDILQYADAELMEDPRSTPGLMGQSPPVQKAAAQDVLTSLIDGRGGRLWQRPPDPSFPSPTSSGMTPPAISPELIAPAPKKKERGFPIGFALLVVIALAVLAVAGFAVSSDKNMRLVKRKMRAAFIGRQPGATVTIDSMPSGAMVSIDGESIGRKTPLVVENIESNIEHDIRLELEGETAVTSTLSVKGGQKKTVLLLFPDAVVNLAVTSEPSGAEVWLDQKSIGFTPSTGQPVRVGQELKLRVVKPGYVEWVKTFVPERKKPLNLDLKLEKSDALLEQEAEEREAMKEAGVEEPKSDAAAEDDKPTKKKKGKRR
jgi:serine/threonine protein kinase